MSPEIQTFLEGVPAYLPSIIVLLVSLIGFYILRSVVTSQLLKISKAQIVETIVNRINDINWSTAVVTAVYFSAYFLPEVSPEVLKTLNIAFLLVWGYQAIKLIFAAINFFVERSIARTGVSNASAYRLLGALAKGLVWVLLGLMLLSNLGYDVTSLIAGLGVGGIAIALAVQTVLGDFISTLSILTDKPFKAGDFIVVGPHKGHVKKIGVRSTRVKSFDGETLVFPNSELVKSTIRNFGGIQRRRAVHKIGVAYETDRKLLRDIPVFILDIVRDTDNVEDSTARANFVGYGDSSLDFEIAFEAISAEYEDFLNVQEQILFKIFDKLSEEGIQFAYPTRTIYTKS